ncbi:Complexin-1 [Varanus komodoensis]|nr:Complexin-1 [Varanus komodoensis]
MWKSSHLWNQVLQNEEASDHPRKAEPGLGETFIGTKLSFLGEEVERRPLILTKCFIFLYGVFVPTGYPYGIKKKEEREAEAQAALEANVEGSLTRPKKAIPPGCGDEDEEEDESILDTVIKYLPGPLQDMFKK